MHAAERAGHQPVAQGAPAFPEALRGEAEVRFFDLAAEAAEIA